ncbi:hypothetical protein KEM55_002116 [Ascosphaera atra]|nr:hypothetical protein KEM55_002116 [Ascosphaera atra]
MDVLRRQNPKSRFVNEDTKNGVFDAIRSQTLYVFVDFKTDGEKTWPYVYEAFKPLREAGYLTTVKNNKTVVPGPVTVIGTGNTPLSKVAAMEPRDIFYDAPLDALEGTEITGKISPIASCSFTQTVGEVKPNGKETLNSKQLDTLRNHISEAKARGIGVRYWDTPLWPVQKRNAVWRTLIDEGVALLNTDDLKAIQKVF